jgi:uncharacterized Tic20 family protein
MEPSQDERSLAALAQSLGIVVAFPVWLKWRNRSVFVRGHAAQSMAFDGVISAALAIVAALAVGLAVAGTAALSGLPGGSTDVARVLLLAVCAPGLALIGCLAVLVTALVLRLRAAMAASQGKSFDYPLLKGRTLEASETSQV